MCASFAPNCFSVNEDDFPRLVLLQVISLGCLMMGDLLITDHGYHIIESRAESFIMIQSTFCSLSYLLQNSALKTVAFVRGYGNEKSTMNELNKLSLKLNRIKSIAKLNESKRMLLVKTLYKENNEYAWLQ